MSSARAPWTAALAGHHAAVAEFIAAARAVPVEHWHAPRAVGKWSPAEETVHVTLAYRVLANELEGGPSMVVRGQWWQRTLLRLMVLPRILRSGKLPSGARAPRELRPPPATDDAATLLIRFDEAAASFTGALAAVRTLDPGRRLVHPYFGPLPLAHVLRFATLHTRHHLAFLPAAERAADGPA